jgi:hypothetical protein
MKFFKLMLLRTSLGGVTEPQSFSVYYISNPVPPENVPPTKSMWSITTHLSTYLTYMILPLSNLLLMYLWCVILKVYNCWLIFTMKFLLILWLFSIRISWISSFFVECYGIITGSPPTKLNTSASVVFVSISFDRKLTYSISILWETAFFISKSWVLKNTLLFIVKFL